MTEGRRREWEAWSQAMTPVDAGMTALACGLVSSHGPAGDESHVEARVIEQMDSLAIRWLRARGCKIQRSDLPCP